MTNQPIDTRRETRNMIDALNADRAMSRPWVIATGERQTMTIAELARVLGISRTSCYEYAHRKELPVPVVRIGRRLLVSRVQVIRWLEGQGGQDGRQ